MKLQAEGGIAAFCVLNLDRKMLLISLGPGRRLAFWFGLVASFAAGLFIDSVTGFGLDKGIATSLILACTISILWAVFPEKMKINLWSVAFILGGGLLGLLYSHFFIGETEKFKTTTPYDIWVYLVNISIIIPLFEELSVRRLMFLGASNWLGPLLSAILVSLLFGWTHKGMFVFALSVSLLLCAATYKGVDTVNRAGFHGAYNLMVAMQLLHHAA